MRTGLATALILGLAFASSGDALAKRGRKARDADVASRRVIAARAKAVHQKSFKRSAIAGLLKASVPLRILPTNLPALPRTENAKVQALVDRANRGATPRRAFLRLERMAAELSAGGEAEQARARDLRGYLAPYKARFVKGWLAKAGERYRSRPTKAPALSSKVKYEVGDAKLQADMNKRLDEAWRILRGLVSPSLLERVPPPEIIVTERFSVPGILLNEDGTKAINLLPGSSVKDILHEYGHLIEDFAPAKTFARVHSIRVRRARAGRTPLSEVLPGTTYAKTETAFPGAFTQAYMGRYYKKGFTEVLSMGIEQFHSRGAAAQFFQRDGDYMLAMLTAMQPD